MQQVVYDTFFIMSAYACTQYTVLILVNITVFVRLTLFVRVKPMFPSFRILHLYVFIRKSIYMMDS